MNVVNALRFRPSDDPTPPGEVFLLEFSFTLQSGKHVRQARVFATQAGLEQGIADLHKANAWTLPTTVERVLRGSITWTPVT